MYSIGLLYTIYISTSIVRITLSSFLFISHFPTLNHTHSTQYTTLHRSPLQLPLAGWVLSFSDSAPLSLTVVWVTHSVQRRPLSLLYVSATRSSSWGSTDYWRGQGTIICRWKVVLPLKRIYMHAKVLQCSFTSKYMLSLCMQCLSRITSIADKWQLYNIR